MKKDGKARVRIFFGEIEGDDATIVDGLRSFAQSLGQTFQPDVRTVRLITSSADGSERDVSLPPDIEAEVLGLGNDDDVAAEAGEVKNKQKKERPKTAPKGVTYSFVKEMNLRPEGKESLRDFYSKKQPHDQQTEVLLVLHYLHRILELEGIAPNHIYTGLKDLSEHGVKVPLNILKILRQLSTRKGFADTSDADDLKMTSQGDNYIEQDLPRK